MQGERDAGERGNVFEGFAGVEQRDGEALNRLVSWRSARSLCAHDACSMHLHEGLQLGER